MRREVLLANPKLHPGKNLVIMSDPVRKENIVWNECRQGDELLITDPATGKKVYSARLLGKSLTEFKSMPKEWVEHNQGRLTRDELFKKMKRLYVGFSKDTRVNLFLLKID